MSALSTGRLYPQEILHSHDLHQADISVHGHDKFCAYSMGSHIVYISCVEFQTFRLISCSVFNILNNTFLKYSYMNLSTWVYQLKCKILKTKFLVPCTDLSRIPVETSLRTYHLTLRTKQLRAQLLSRKFLFPGRSTFISAGKKHTIYVPLRR